MTRAIPIVSSFSQQEFFRRIRCSDGEALECTFVDPPLHRLKFQLNDAPQLIVPESAKDDYLINPVAEFGRKVSSRRFYRSVVDLLIQLIRRQRDRAGRREADRSVDQVAHFRRTELGGHEDYRLRKIHSPVIAER